MADINLLVIDDSAVVRDFVGLILRSEPGINLVGGASSRAEALAMLERLKVDAVTLDMYLPDCVGTAMLDELIDVQGCGVVMLSGDPEHAMADCKRAGCELFDKSHLLEHRTEFVAAIRRVARHGKPLPRAARPRMSRERQGDCAA